MNSEGNYPWLAAMFNCTPVKRAVSNNVDRLQSAFPLEVRGVFSPKRLSSVIKYISI